MEVLQSCLNSLSVTYSFVCHRMCRITEKIGDFVPYLNSVMGFDPNTPLRFFEEIKPSMVEPLKLKATLQGVEISVGDIICFQKEMSNAEYVEFLCSIVCHSSIYSL